MEKRKLSGKTILKLAGALLALAYLGFYFNVGITGKLPDMHETVHIMRYGDRKKWVAGGMTAAMILGICINSALNDLNLKRIRKESFLPLFFTMIFPIILLLLLEAFKISLMNNAIGSDIQGQKENVEMFCQIVSKLG